jgi:magnesium transporter
MNFTHMPELSAPYAYFILIGVCILIVAVEIWYFKKKGWF